MYKVNRDKEGKVLCISKQNSDGSTTSFGIESRHYREFLEWNSQQATPLDLFDHAPDPPTPEEVARQDNLSLIKTLKSKSNWTPQELEDVVRAIINLNF